MLGKQDTGCRQNRSSQISRLTLEAQGHLVRVKSPGLPPIKTSCGARGAVTRFSRPSRKRMLALMARIDTERDDFVTFITLTYPDRKGPPDPRTTERDRRTLFKRIDRAYPECSAIWRREQQARKSGAFEGVVFPHYHALMFS